MKRLPSSDPWARLDLLGYRKPRALRAVDEPAREGRANPDGRSDRALPGPGADTVVLSICTYDHAHYARTLYESVREHHPELPFVLVVADAERLGFPDIPGAHLVAPRDLDLPEFPYLTLKYSASELCCALKPLALRWLMSTGRASSVVYLDSDICLYAPMDRLLYEASSHPAVVTPHVRAPFPQPERLWERPSLGDLAFAGVLNAGMFSLTLDEDVARFLDTWSELVTQPGAFMPTQGGQWEQNSFNWIVSFLEDVFILKDPAYNVAYWNLHDRSLRWTGLDADTNAWTVDGQPLVAFHFSGYSLAEPLTLSAHDRRYSMFHMPSVARLTEDYAERLKQHGATRYGRAVYGFAQFGRGLVLDARIRRIFQEDEVFLRCETDPWGPGGETCYGEALMSPIPHRGSLLPVLIESIYRERPDLQHLWPDADVNPDAVFAWFGEYGVREYEYRTFFERYRQTIPPPAAAGPRPTGAADAEAGPAKATVRTDSSRARAAPWSKDERPFVSKVTLLRTIHRLRADVREWFPDLFFADADGYLEWLALYGCAEELVPEECIAAFRRCSGGRALARLFSFLNRTPEFVAAWPLALVGEQRLTFAREMLRLQRHGLEFDVDDIAMYLWMMEEQPWSGVELTLELLPHLARIPSSRLPEGAAQLFAPLVARDPRFGDVLRDIRTRAAEDGRREIEAIRATEAAASRDQRATAFLHAKRLRALGDDGGASVAPPQRHGPSPQRQETGVNMFGFFKSPIGLGEMTRGLDAALRTIGVRTARNLVGNIAMDERLMPSDFVRRFRHDYARNIFVSTPHADGMPLRQHPAWMISGRENIAYLAWEQRDGSHYWREIFADFDQVWALSSFAARSLERAIERTVHPVPCVLDIDALPARGSKSHFGFDPDTLVVLYVFDANSSIERKNPEAALRAFSAAFGPSDRVQLCIKITNGARLDHRARLAGLLREAAKLGPRVRIMTETLSRPDTLRLISSVDCYMSLHRAEGFGYTCAEAMGYGVPVIATRYSGNLDFMDDTTAFLVDAREIEVRTAEGPFQRGSIWADPDIECAVHALRTVYRSREEAAARGQRGQALVVSRLSSSAIGKRLAVLLGTISAAETEAASSPTDVVVR